MARRKPPADAADLDVDLPRQVRYVVLSVRGRPETVRLIVRFPDGTFFDEWLPTRRRLREDEPDRAEADRLNELRQLCRLKVGHRYMVRYYDRKWTEQHIDRWLRDAPRKPAKLRQYEQDRANKKEQARGFCFKRWLTDPALVDRRGETKAVIGEIKRELKVKVSGGDVAKFKREFRNNS